MSPTEWVADPSATLEWFRAELAEWEVANAQRALSADEPAEPWAGCRDAIDHLERSLAQPAAERPSWPKPDPSEIKRFLTLLGKPKGSSRLRAFFPKGHAKKKGDPGRKGRGGLKQIEAWQREERGAYIVVANGGDSEKEITGSTAFFIEHDDRPKAWQLGCWRELGLPRPSMQIDTAGRSVHSYWVLKSPMDPQAWRVIQERLLKYAQADTSIGDIPRVMRLPGTWHMNAAGKPDGMARIISASGKRYTPQEIEACLPPEPSAEPSAAPASSPAPSRAHAARPLEEVREALLQIPQILPDTGQRERFRSLAWGLLCAVREAGADDGMALALLEEHSPLVRDAAEYLKTDPHSVTAATFWHLAREAGWRPEREHRRQQKPSAAVPAAPRLAPAEADADHAGPAGPTPSAGGVVSRKTRVGSDEVLTLLPYRLGELRLNVRSGEVHSSAKGVISSNEISRLYLELSRPFEVWPKDATADGITLLASRDPFDPVREWLESLEAEPLPLEQWHRLDQHLLGIDDPIAASFLPRFLISAVARAMEPGAYVRQVPVLIGAQERGKGELGRILFGAEHWVEGVGALDRDALMKAHTAWGVELAELDGVTRRADQEHLKAFITEIRDTFRKPYDRAPECHPRKFVFWGTANRPPLRDSSGSTRFVCIPIPDRPLPLEWARQNRSALWARALQQYRSGVTWLRTSEAERLAVEARNSDFTELDPWADPVADFLRRAQSEGRLPVRVPEVLAHLEVPRERQTTAAAKRVREIAEGQGWRHARRWVGRDRPQGLWPPNDGHPGHTPDTPRGVCSDPSDASGSGHVGHPGHPYSLTVEEVGEGQESDTPATHPAPITQEVSSPKGCPVCPQPQTDCSAADLAKPGGVSIGVSGGVSIPTTVADWCEVALAELRLAPDPRHLPKVHDWLQRHPAAPGCTRTALAAALERLRQEDADHDQQTVLDTP